MVEQLDNGDSTTKVLLYLLSFTTGVRNDHLPSSRKLVDVWSLISFFFQRVLVFLRFVGYLDGIDLK